MDIKRCISMVFGASLRRNVIPRVRLVPVRSELRLSSKRAMEIDRRKSSGPKPVASIQQPLGSMEFQSIRPGFERVYRDESVKVR